MLSYRHAFHAGNFADVLKHSVLHYVLNYMGNKDKGYTYIDTHSGAGMYKLHDEYAQKTGEYKQGIEKLYNADDLSPLLEEYVALIKQLNQGKPLNVYPGSPAIAHFHARKQDSARLFELHKSDAALLTSFTEKWRQAQVMVTDGYKGLIRQLPPTTRRGVVLIDPPYEIKTDYQKAVKAIIDGSKKFATGTYILWYPVVTRSLIEDMEASLLDSGIRNVLKAEFRMKPDSEQYGMTGTGLFIVNPPWQLKGLLEDALPQLKSLLASENSNEASFNINQMVEE